MKIYLQIRSVMDGNETRLFSAERQEKVVEARIFPNHH